MEQNISKKSEREQRKERAIFKSKMKKVVWGLVIVVVIGGLMGLSSSGAEKKIETANTLTTVVDDDYVVGPADASVTLVEYLDFECEACGAYYPLIKQLEEEFPNDLRVVTRYFPLPGHRNGMTSAFAVEAAARQGKYHEMHDLLFEEQINWGERPTPDPSIFEEYAAQLGIDIEQFKQDVSSQSVRDRVERDMDSGRQLGNRGTPSFFLNGQKIDSPRGYEPFRQLIIAEIEKAN